MCTLVHFGSVADKIQHPQAAPCQRHSQSDPCQPGALYLPPIHYSYSKCDTKLKSESNMKCDVQPMFKFASKLTCHSHRNYIPSHPRWLPLSYQPKCILDWISIQILIYLNKKKIKVQVAPSLLPASLLSSHSSLPGSTTSLGSISAAVTKQEEKILWREGGAEDSSEEEEEEEEDSEDCEEEDEEEEEGGESEDEESWGCPHCGRLAHPQKILLPSQATQLCSNHSFLSFDGDSTGQSSSGHLPIEEHPCQLMSQEEVSYCQHEVATCCQTGCHTPCHMGCHAGCQMGCQMHRHWQCYHRQLLQREDQGPRCLESRGELQNKKCCSFKWRNKLFTLPPYWHYLHTQSISFGTFDISDIEIHRADC